MSWFRVGVALALCWIAWATRAEAQAQLVWSAPADCSRAGFDAELARLLAGSPALSRPMAGRVVVSRQQSQLTLELRLRQRETRSERELVLESCAEAQRAAALLIATALDPERAHAAKIDTGLAPPPRSASAPGESSQSPDVAPSGRRAELAASAASAKDEAQDGARAEASAGAPEPAPPAAPTAPPPPPAPAPPAPAPPAPAPPAPPDAPQRGGPLPPVRDSSPRAAGPWSLRVGAQLAVASLPGVSAGPELGVSVTHRRVHGWLVARYLAPRTRHDDDSSLRAGLDLFAGALGGSWQWPHGAFSLGPQVELELGALRARGRGELTARTAFVPWGAASVGALAMWRAPRWLRLGLSAAASLPLSRPAFQLGEEAPFFRTEPVAFRLAIVLQLAPGLTRGPGRGQ